jgi:hypothetical protein
MTTWLDEERIISSLDPFTTLPDWLAAGMHGDRVAQVLEQHVPEFARGDLKLVSCWPQRLRSKEDEWLARYSLMVAAPGEEAREVVLVGNLWAPSQGARMPEAYVATNTPLGEPDWWCWLPELRLELHGQEADPALPALPTITEPDQAAELLQPILRDAGYPGVTIAECFPDVVRYKPGSRCTVVVRLTYADPGTGPTPPAVVVLKTHQGDKGQTAWAAMTALWDNPASWAEHVMLAQPLAFFPEDRILVQGPIPEERTLKVLAREAITDGSPEAIDELRDELAKTARALVGIHRSQVAYGRTATYEDELAEVREVLDRLSLTVPNLARAAEPLVTRLGQLSRAVPADGIVPAHHDFRPAQVLLSGGQVGFIDFDGACMAEPALDLGRFRAKLRDIGVSTLTADGRQLEPAAMARNFALMDDLCEHFLASYMEHAPVSRTRVLLWESCDLLTAMLHAWTKVRLLRLEPRMAVLVNQLRTGGLPEVDLAG